MFTPLPSPQLELGSIAYESHVTIQLDESFQHSHSAVPLNILAPKQDRNKNWRSHSFQ